LAFCDAFIQAAIKDFRGAMNRSFSEIKVKTLNILKIILIFMGFPKIFKTK